MRADTVNQRKRRRLHRKADERGMALIMVLLSIVVLTVFATEVQQESSTALASAISARERLKAEYAARSAVNLTRLLIATEPTIRAAVAPMLMLLTQGKGEPPQIPVWEFVDQVLGAYNCADRQQGFNELAGVDTSTGESLGLGSDTCFDVVVVDEDALINVNIAAKGDSISRLRIAGQLLSLMAGPQYNPLFENLDADGQHTDRQTLCGALVDWADSDEDVELCDVSAQAPTSRGVEDNFYQSIGLPYFRKNAAYDSLEELRLVRGVSDDFWATFVDPKPDDPKKRTVTVWGQDAINVNTANAQTLLAIVCAGAVPETPLCTDPLQMATFLQVITLAKTFTAGAPLFGSPSAFVSTMEGKGLIGPQLQAMGVQPVTFLSRELMKNGITTRSKIFSIYAEGSVAGRNRETRLSIHAVVDFRNATEVTNTTAPAAGGSLAGPLQPSGSANQSGAGGVLTPEELLAALSSNPAGNVVYWRIQ